MKLSERIEHMREVTLRDGEKVRVWRDELLAEVRALEDLNEEYKKQAKEYIPYLRDRIVIAEDDAAAAREDVRVLAAELMLVRDELLIIGTDCDSPGEGNKCGSDSGPYCTQHGMGEHVDVARKRLVTVDAVLARPGVRTLEAKRLSGGGR